MMLVFLQGDLEEWDSNTNQDFCLFLIDQPGKNSILGMIKTD